MIVHSIHLTKKALFILIMTITIMKFDHLITIIIIVIEAVFIDIVIFKLFNKKCMKYWRIFL